MINFSIFLLVILPILVVTAAAKILFAHTISWGEAAAQLVICILMVAALYTAGYNSKTGDVRVLSGEIVGKGRITVPCSHSYSCNCRPSCYTSGGVQTCNTVCSTCYRHPNDWRWNVKTNVGGDFAIDRIDSRGSAEPPRFTSIKLGDPYSANQSYVNYVKAVPESLINMDSVKIAQFDSLIPEYPQIYDYYHINRVIAVGVAIPNIKEWNKYLSDKMKAVGPAKQANINIVIVNTPDQTYRYALEAKWHGGKKNDITVIVGMTTYGKMEWVDTITFGGNAGNSLMTVLMRDRLMALPEFEYKQVIDTISTTVLEKFDRKPMKDFEYLNSGIYPPDWCIYASLMLGLALSLGCAFVFHRN